MKLPLKLRIVTLAVGLAAGVHAADRTEIKLPDGPSFPESLTSTSDGTVYFGSLGLDSVFRAGPHSPTAQPWIQPKANGLQMVLGVLADEAAGTLWVCSSASGGGNGAPTVGETALKAFNLKDAALKGSYPFPGGGLCNDMAVGNDGTVYATDTRGGRVIRLKKGAAAADVWADDKTQLAGADGIALLADGAVYVNSIGQGTLMRIPVAPDGSAGTPAILETSQPLARPDGMRSVGARTLLLVEGAGRLNEVIVEGSRATVRTLKDGLVSPTAVTLVDGMAFVTEAKLNYRSDPSLRGKDPGPFRAIGIPYRPSN
jgi:sugar lactone lactonase YvrE